MKIAMIGRYAEGAILTGPEKAARRLFHEISREQGIEVVFIEYFFDGKIHGRWKKIAGRERLDAPEGERWRLGISRIPSFLSRFKPDALAIVTFERYATVALLWAALHGIPALYIVHGVVRYENETHRTHTPASLRRRDAIAERFIFNRASLLCFLSEDSISLARRYCHVKDERIMLSDNGVDDVFTQVSYSARDPQRPFTVVFTGDPGRREKGWEFLFSALSRLDFPLRLVVIGANMSPETKLPPNVSAEFLPPSKPATMADIFAQADCHVCASIFETYSISTAEAMAAGLPAIATRSTGIARHIRHGENGLLVDYGNADELAQMLSLLYSDDELRLRLAANARRTAGELTWRTAAEKYIKALERLARSRRHSKKNAVAPEGFG